MLKKLKSIENDPFKTALLQCSFDEALRLYTKANRIHSDNRSLEAIKNVQEKIREKEEVLELEEAEKERKRRMYEALSPKDRELGK